MKLHPAFLGSLLVWLGVFAADLGHAAGFTTATWGDVAFDAAYLTAIAVVGLLHAKLTRRVV